MQKSIFSAIRPNFFVEINRSEPQTITVAQILSTAPKNIETARSTNDTQLLCNICRHLITSMESPDKNLNFAAAFLNRDTIKEATALISSILTQIPGILKAMNGEKVAELKQWQCLIHFSIVFNSSSTWALVRNAPNVQPVLNGLCAKMSSSFNEIENYEKLTSSLFIGVNSNKPLIGVETVNAQFMILHKPIREENSKLMPIFICKVLTCPAILLHLNPQNIEQIKVGNFFFNFLNFFQIYKNHELKFIN